MSGRGILTHEDFETLVEVVVYLPAFGLGTERERVLFLQRAGCPAAWIQSFTWDGPALAAATQLIMVLNHADAFLDGLPGYTALGQFLRRLIVEERVGRETGLALARLILRYHLLDPAQASVPLQVQKLLDAAGSVPSGAVSANLVLGAALPASLNPGPDYDRGWLRRFIITRKLIQSLLLCF